MFFHYNLARVSSTEIHFLFKQVPGTELRDFITEAGLPLNSFEFQLAWHLRYYYVICIASFTKRRLAQQILYEYLFV